MLPVACMAKMYLCPKEMHQLIVRSYIPEHTCTSAPTSPPPPLLGPPKKWWWVHTKGSLQMLARYLSLCQEVN